ncbi:MAG: flavocytochrome c [Clostridia bacterium]|nr:flavocytochrome c [Clostridia bacterium]
MKNRLFALLTVLAMLLFVVPAMADTVTGTGTAKGFGGDITVTVTLNDGVISDVVIVGDAETQGIGSVAVENFGAEMVNGNTVNVDVMSGATFSSNGILEAARAALTDAGVNPDDYMAKADKATAEDVTLDADVVVVGAGGAGMIAAITAADAGNKVVIVESQAMVGGNSVKATGGMNAADTPYQDDNTFGESAGVEKMLASAASKYADNADITALAETVKGQWEAYQANPEGYFDTAELMELDTMIGGYGVNNIELVKKMCESSADAIAWLDTQNIHLNNVGAAGGASVKRIHRPVDENGKALSVGAYVVPLLKEAVDSRENVTLLFNTTATAITMKDGAAAGIVTTGKDGETVTINAKAVVLASGGFGANLDMVASYKPELKGFMTTNAPGIQGQGILMAQEVGAATVDMDQIQIHPTVQYDSSNLITEGLRGDGAILVNVNGERFIDEVGTRDVVSAAEIAQPQSFSWLIIDNAMLEASNVIKGYQNKGYTFEGNTYEELAAAIGIPADTFAATMNAWNGYVEAKNDPDFGRVSFAQPLNTAPYYAIKVTAGIHHTMGGVKIDTDTHVISTEGNVIPGLFAAGEVTGGVHGANRLGGTAVCDFVVYGRIAGQSAAEYVK